MEILQTEASDKENSTRYILKDQEKNIGFGYIFNRETNPIEIYINEEYQSNGYGKKLFNYLLEKLKEQNIKGVIFLLNEKDFKLINIISQAGAIKVGRIDSNIKFILKLS